MTLTLCSWDKEGCNEDSSSAMTALRLIVWPGAEECELLSAIGTATQDGLDAASFLPAEQQYGEYAASLLLSHQTTTHACSRSSGISLQSR